MKPNKVTKKAWAVLEENRLTCWGTRVSGLPDTSNVWQYPIFFSRKEAIAWAQGMNIEIIKVIPVDISYVLPPKSKKK